jgi:hypothetical protein
MAGDHADITQRQLLGRHERGRDEERLGLRGVSDLVHVGVRAEMYEIDAGEYRPPVQACLYAREGEPRDEESGFLGALTWSEDCEHDLTVADTGW